MTTVIVEVVYAYVTTVMVEVAYTVVTTVMVERIEPHIFRPRGGGLNH